MRIVLLGLPGSGKGTQGELLARRLGVAHVASGELLRAHVEAETELGREVAARLARGDLVPDEAVMELVCAAVTVACESGGYILDGFPRTLAQAEHAYELAEPKGIAAEAAVYLELADDIARKRLAGRAGAGRPDDADAGVIERRLQLFHANTRPILDFYEGRGILVTVDAAQSPDAVTDAVLDALSRLSPT